MSKLVPLLRLTCSDCAREHSRYRCIWWEGSERTSNAQLARTAVELRGGTRTFHEFYSVNFRVMSAFILSHVTYPLFANFCAGLNAVAPGRTSWFATVRFLTTPLDKVFDDMICRIRVICTAGNDRAIAFDGTFDSARDAMHCIVAFLTCGWHVVVHFVHSSKDATGLKSDKLEADASLAGIATLVGSPGVPGVFSEVETLVHDEHGEITATIEELRKMGGPLCGVDHVHDFWHKEKKIPEKMLKAAEKVGLAPDDKRTFLMMENIVRSSFEDLARACKGDGETFMRLWYEQCSTLVPAPSVDSMGRPNPLTGISLAMDSFMRKFLPNAALAARFTGCLATSHVESFNGFIHRAIPKSKFLKDNTYVFRVKVGILDWNLSRFKAFQNEIVNSVVAHSSDGEVHASVRGFLSDFSSWRHKCIMKTIEF